jgi:HPt (histidine-containing phosphotransfer) domain-containing protein
MSDRRPAGEPSATPSMPTPAQPTATLDAGALARLRELDPDGRHGVVQRVLAAFDTSLTRMLAQLRAERDGGRADVVMGIAHTLKSSSASVGALGLARLCEHLERQLRGAAGSAQRHDVEALIAEGEAALAAVRTMLSPRAAPPR